jgi:AraC-like DNA-binding protein
MNLKKTLHANASYLWWRSERSHFNDINQTDKHYEHELNVICKGSLQYSCGDNETVTLHSGQIIAIPSGIEHRLSVDEHVLMYGFHVDDDYLQNIVKKNPISPVNKLFEKKWVGEGWRVISDATTFNMFINMFEQIEMQHSHYDSWSNEVISELSHLIMINYLRIYESETKTLYDDPTDARVIKIILWIERNYLKTVKLEELAEMAHLSVTHFSYIFHKITKTSPVRYLIERRLNCAATLLKETEQSVSIIAVKSGFNDMAHFNTSFKQYYGVTPGKYRKIS